MIITREVYVFGDFSPWGNAVDTWKKMEEYSGIETFLRSLECEYPDGLSEDSLNDLLSFDVETCADFANLQYDPYQDAWEDEIEDEDEEETE